MRSFVIHMSASTARHDNATCLRDQLPGGEIVEAVNGRDPAQVSDVATAPGTLFRPHYPFALKPAETGVFQSHRKVWRKIVDEDSDFAIVTEDDLKIDPARFATVLELIKPFATADSYIRLPVKQAEVPAQTVAERGDLRLILPKVIGLQCICQVVGRNAAHRLLQATDQIDRPVDTLIQMHWRTGQPVHSVLGSGNCEVAAQIGGSTIQQKVTGSGKLAREAKRAWYRAQIAMKPQRPG